MAAFALLAACSSPVSREPSGDSPVVSTDMEDMSGGGDARVSAARQHRAGRPYRHGRHRSRGFHDGGACPCGSGRICIGPRGGRYCITSGGNKEYGQ